MFNRQNLVKQTYKRETGKIFSGTCILPNQHKYCTIHENESFPPFEMTKNTRERERRKGIAQVHELYTRITPKIMT